MHDGEPAMQQVAAKVWTPTGGIQDWTAVNKPYHDVEAQQEESARSHQLFLDMKKVHSSASACFFQECHKTCYQRCISNDLRQLCCTVKACVCWSNHHLCVCDRHLLQLRHCGWCCIPAGISGLRHNRNFMHESLQHALQTAVSCTELQQSANAIDALPAS